MRTTPHQVGASFHTIALRQVCIQGKLPPHTTLVFFARAHIFEKVNDFESEDMLVQQWQGTAPTPLQAWMAIAELALTGNLKDIFFHDTNTYINTHRAPQGGANRCFFFTKGADYYIPPLLSALGRNTRQGQNLYLSHGDVAINLRLNPQYDGVSWIIQDQTPQHKKPQTHHELMALRHLFPKELQTCY